MTRQGRHSAPSSLHTAEEARSGPRRGVAGSVPGWALPPHGTLGRPLSQYPEPSALLACVGFGTRAASRVTTAFAQYGGDALAGGARAGEGDFIDAGMTH